MQHDQRHSNDLRQRIGFTDPAGLKNFHAARGVEQRTNDQNNDVAAEDQHRDPPGNFVRRGEHQKHSAQQELVGDGIKILPYNGLLFHQARQQAIQAVTDAGGNKDGQGPVVMVAQHRNHGERNKDQAEQGEQVRRGAQLADHGWGSSKYLAMFTPVLATNWSAREGSSPFWPSASIRCTRCMGKKTRLAVADSPVFTSWVKSSSDCKSMPRRLTPAGLSDSIKPQNFSRGLVRVTRTICPVFILWQPLALPVPAFECCSFECYNKVITRRRRRLATTGLRFRGCEKACPKLILT